MFRRPCQFLTEITWKGSATQVRSVTCLLLASLAAPTLANPDEDQQTWGAVFNTGHLSALHPKARFWLEGQGRFGDDTSRFSQGILRAGLGWAVSEHWVLWGGYAWIPSDPPGPSNGTREHRLWQQAMGNGGVPASRLNWVARTRLEQRWLEHADDTGWRLRQFAKLTHPLTSGGRVYASVWDEVFFALNATDWGARAGLDQNRAFAGFGVRLGKGVSTEVGYLHQYVFRASRPDASNHILSLNLFVNWPAP